MWLFSSRLGAIPWAVPSRLHQAPGGRQDAGSAQAAHVAAGAASAQPPQVPPPMWAQFPSRSSDQGV